MTKKLPNTVQEKRWRRPSRPASGGEQSGRRGGQSGYWQTAPVAMQMADRVISC